MKNAMGILCVMGIFPGKCGWSTVAFDKWGDCLWCNFLENLTHS